MISQSELNRKIETVLSCQAAVKPAIRPGVESYLKIQDMYSRQAIDPDFQRLFRTFYRVRGTLNRDSLWDILKKREEISIVAAMKALVSSKRPAVHLSFASKALHTINPDLPIYDSTVRDFFGLSIPPPGLALDKRLAFREGVYNDLKGIYAGRDTNHLFRLAEAFDGLFPQYQETITEVKKIDFMIWGFGR